MTNPLKRLLNLVEDDAGFADEYHQNAWQGYGSTSFEGAPRRGEHHGPSFMNPASDVPAMQPADSLPGLVSGLLLDPNGGSQASEMNLDELDNYLDPALTEWGNTISQGGLNLSQTTPRCQEVSHSPTPSPTPEASQSRTESASPVDYDEIVCYGLLHQIDVKLVGKTEIIQGMLDRDSHVSGYGRFKLSRREDHVLLSFQEGGEEFGYLRSGVAGALKPLLANPNVELEPLAPITSLKEAISRSKKPADVTVKMDINVYGRGGKPTASDVGGVLSRGKLWLQKPYHAKPGVAYDNPHFLSLKIKGVQVQAVQPVVQTANDGIASRKRREERLRRMVEDVYKSMDNTRHLTMVDGGTRVTRKLLKHQQEALGFMLERESGHINDKYRLWRLDVQEDGMEEYRHRITNARWKQDTQPDERGGGILADEMGMGKTLSILALAMNTIDVGEEWARQQNSDNEGHGSLKKYTRSTLVVVPSALLMKEWTDEVNKHLEDGVKVIRYHGSKRPKDPEAISDSDVVVTTYNTLTTDFQSKRSPLHHIGWYRVVLDEAHTIRRSGTHFYRACNELHANSRWCLTGTPIQNKLADLGTLFAFIRAEPFSRANVFRKWIEMPFEQSAEDPGAVKDRLILLLEALCLRRTKDVIELPRLRQRMRTLTFTADERAQYVSTQKILMRVIRHRQGVDGVDKISKFGLFQANLQMRLLCNHGTFQQPFSWNRRSYQNQDEREALVTALGQNAEITCSSCQLAMPILGSSRLGGGFREHCSHVLCSECLEDAGTPAVAGQAQSCPVCVRWLATMPGRAQGATDVAMPDALARQNRKDDDDYYFDAGGHSTKIRALIDDVQADLWTTKSIIFSCWTRTLHLVARHLKAGGIPYLRVDGGCTLLERQNTLEKFAEDDAMPVLIMTTGTGGVGLNLTCANRIFIVELQWNPGVESQAIARAIRMGQEREVHVTRYMIKDTVEEEMRSQQQWKKQLAALGFEEVPDIIDDERGVS